MEGSDRWIRYLGTACLGMALMTGQGLSQVVERDTTITGPRGRSINRQVEIERTPGGVERQIKITRPGGTFQRDVQIQRVPGAGGFMPTPMGARGWMPRPVFIQPAPAFGFGLMAAPLLNFSFGGGGVGVGGPMMGPVGGGGMMGGGPAAPPRPPPDQVAIETQRLQSFHVNTRKEAAYALGKLGDRRAVPSLVNLLKNDYFKDVRVASAIALGEIGGSEAAVALERSAIYDHKEEVKKASSTALVRLNAKAKANAEALARARTYAPAPAPPPTAVSPFGPSSSGYPTGQPEGARAPSKPSSGTPDQGGELIPPPPPTPVGPSGNP